MKSNDSLEIRRFSLRYRCMLRPTRSSVRGSLWLCLALVLLGESTARAQDRVPAPSVLDTVAARLVATAVIGTLDHAFARALVASHPQEWTIEIPDSTSPAWRRLADGLSRMLATRAEAPRDDIERFVVRIRPYSMRGDTLIARFHFDESYPCTRPGASLSSHTIIFEVRAVRRHGRFLSSPTTRQVMTGHGRC